MANPLTEIEITDYYSNLNNFDYDFLNSERSDFSVNFTHQRIDRIIVSFPNLHIDDYVSHRNAQTINESSTMVFNPNINLTIFNIKFCLEHCLKLDKELSQEIINQLKTYVEIHPRPTSLHVYINQVSEYHYEQLSSSSVVSLLESGLLKRIKVEDIKGFKEDNGDCCCPICLVDFSVKKDVMVTCMPCNHVFHNDCILMWLKNCERTISCPVCRYELGKKDLSVTFK